MPLSLFVDHLQGVDQPCQRDGRGALLVVVPDRDLRFFAQGVENVETFRVGDVFKVDPAEARLEQQHGVDDDVRVFGVEHDRNGVHTTQILVQQGFPLHDGQSGFWADVAETEHARSIAHHDDGVPFVGVLVHQFGIRLDGFAGSSHAGRVPDGKVIETVHCAFQGRFDLAPVEWVQFHGVCRGLFGFCEQFVYIHGVLQ
jgi:hypothetical protein